MTPPAPTADAIALDALAYHHHQARALEALPHLGPVAAELRLDRFTRPPPLARVPPERLSDFSQFLHHRLRAELARRRLVAAAHASDPSLETAAIRAVGGLTQGPSGPSQTAAAIDGLTTGDALALAEKALGNLRLDDAEGMLVKLRNNGHLERRELAEALEMLGAIQRARGRTDLSERTFGQALCAEPGLPSTVPVRALAAAFREAQARSPCTEPIRITEVHVLRDQGEHGLVYRVVADIGGDPFGLVEGGDLQIWGSGGAMFAADRPRSTERNGRRELAGTIEDTGNMETYTGQILVKVFLRDLSGVVIDSFGDPDPVSLPIERGEHLPAVAIPWWVWAVAAGVAVAAAGTVTAIVLTKDSGEPPLGIGPIDVSF